MRLSPQSPRLRRKSMCRPGILSSAAEMRMTMPKPALESAVSSASSCAASTYATGRCVQRAVGNVAAQRLGILAVTVDLGFKNGHLLGDAQGVELQPPRGGRPAGTTAFCTAGPRRITSSPVLRGARAAQEFQRGQSRARGSSAATAALVVYSIGS